MCLCIFRLISIARYAFKSPRICFRGTKHEIYLEHVAYLLSIFSAPGPAAISKLELFASAVGKSRFLSRMTYFVLVYCTSGDYIALLSESYTFVCLIELMLPLLDL